jgi:hypothetical protein
MKRMYTKPTIEITSVDGEKILSGSGVITQRQGSIGADNKVFQNDFCDGCVSGVIDVTTDGPSSSAKHNSFWDE